MRCVRQGEVVGLSAEVAYSRDNSTVLQQITPALWTMYSTSGITFTSIGTVRISSVKLLQSPMVR